MEYLKYYKKDGFWHPPRGNANISEILHNVAGRGVKFDMGEQMPKSTEIYWKLESEYREKTGRRAHTSHQLTDEQYKIVVAELEELINYDPCDREWIKY